MNAKFSRSTAVLLLLLSFTTAVVSQEPKAVGLYDLVVYKPGVHDRDLPKVLFEELKANGKVVGEDPGQRIDIPPTVHVHRYYYSGDKEIQGPIVAGGPTVVVANHPKTGQRMYFDVILPNGAPKIAYNKKGITYVYADQRVSVEFRSFPHDPNKAIVKYHSGRGVRRRVHEHVSAHVQKVKQHWQQSPAVEAIKSANQKTHDGLRNIGQKTGTAVKQFHDSAKSLVSYIPGVSPLLNPPSDSAAQQKLAQVKAAGDRNFRTAPQFAPTNR